MQATPLQIAQKVIYRHFETDAPLVDPDVNTHQFTLGFPSNSNQQSRNYETQLNWDQGGKMLFVSIAVDGAPFMPWPELDLFLKTLDARMTIFLPAIDGGCGKLTAFDAPPDKQKKAPGHIASFNCAKITEQAAREVLVPVYARAVSLLHYAHIIFRFIAATGSVPDVVAQMRLLLLEYGKSEVLRDLTEDEVKHGPRVDLPPGLYGGIEHLPMQ